MLTIAFIFSAAFIYYIFKLVLKQKDTGGNTHKSMEQHEQEVRCSSSESDNFEKIDSDDIKPNGDPHFVVGDEEVPEDEGPAHEGRDSFPNAPPPNLKPKLTVAQQLALAEKRSKLKRDVIKNMTS